MEKLDQVIIITGASSGIGEATAKKLASHGASIVLTARREDRLKELQDSIEKEGGKAIVVVGDVAKKKDLENVVSKAKETFGTVNAIVNNAGLMPLSYVEKLKTDEWDKMVEVNIKGVLNGVAAVLPTLIENKGGHIINISSMAAHRYFPGGAVYCATKSAVKMFSEGLRQELSPKYGINVSSIEPGAVSTELTETITDKDLEGLLEDLEKMTSLEPEDIAEAILYIFKQPERVNVNDVYLVPSEQQ